MKTPCRNGVRIPETLYKSWKDNFERNRMKRFKSKTFQLFRCAVATAILFGPCTILANGVQMQERFNTLPFVTSQWALMTNATRHLPAVGICLYDNNFHCVLPDTVSFSRKSPQIVLAAGCKQQAKFAALTFFKVFRMIHHPGRLHSCTR